MVTVDLSHSHTNHTEKLVELLAKTGWRALSIPAQGKLKRNHQLIELRAPTTSVKVRFSVFTVGDRGESHRRDERRIQITTTYLSGLERLGEYKDIVLGYDSHNNVYVGLDARRLNFGGEKHNASSSVDPAALEKAPVKSILIYPHDTKLLGLEYQAIFSPGRLAEYIFNADSVHRDLYIGGGLFSDSPRASSAPRNALTVPSENARGEVLILRTPWIPRTKRKVKRSRVAAYENGDWAALADVSPEELAEIRRKCAEIGDRGEYFALSYERQRLRKAGKELLARDVKWVSRRSVGMGYDIKSYESDGSPRLIEVKSTIGHSMTFPMSDGEWKVAAREKNAYYIYRIVDVGVTPTLKRIVQNPIAAEAERMLERTASGWRVELK